MINQHEVAYALPWLHGKLKLPEDVNLYYLLGNMRLGQHLQWYKTWKVPGTDRVICSPQGHLRLVQERIQTHILSKFPKHPASNGFAGGSCFKALSAHLGFRSLLSFDLRHAFPSVTHYQVFEALYNPHNVYAGREPGFGFYCARFLADLCTVGNIRECEKNEDWCSQGGELPQGAPTSPRLFELCMRPLDDELTEFAGRYMLRYTRYADNLIFSSEAEPKFPDELRRVILGLVGKYFRVHKVRQQSYGEMQRCLGLNIDSYRVRNTKDFKNAFRKALHHLAYCLEHRLDFSHAWAVVRGYAGFSVMETLPENLVRQYEDLVSRVNT